MPSRAAFMSPLPLLVSALVCFAGPASSRPASRPGRVLPAGQTQADLTAYLLKKVPKFTPPTSADWWSDEVRSVRQRLLDQVVLRGVPASWTAGSPEDVKVVWGEVLDGKGYVIKKLRYEALPGLWIGGLLYEPKGLSKEVPAVLCVNGHVGAPGMTIDYEQVKCINLARRGMLAFHPEWIGMGQLGGAGYGHLDAVYLELCGVSGVSVHYLALKRALDVLLMLRWTDPGRVAVTGLSGGGWQTIFISALDPRVKLCAPNAGYIGLEERIKNLGDVGDLEQNPTDLIAVADYPFLTAMLAPRPALLIYNEKDDCCFAAERAKRSVFDPIAPVYALLGAADRFELHINKDPGTHNYLKDNREAFYRFINRQFLPEGERRDEEMPVDDEIRKAEELKVDYPAENASFYTLAGELMKSLPRKPGYIPRGSGPTSFHGYPETKDHSRPVIRARVPVIDGWHVPVREYIPEKEPAEYVLIVADGGWEAAEPMARDLWKNDDTYVAIMNVLFTGECQPDSGAAWQWAQMISACGDRVLNIQAAQIAQVQYQLARERDMGNMNPQSKPARGSPLAINPVKMRILAMGRVSALAALKAAGGPARDRTTRVELQGVIPSLKQLLEKRISYADAPSMFCFGLLADGDVEDLIVRAAPCRVEMKRE